MTANLALLVLVLITASYNVIGLVEAKEEVEEESKDCVGNGDDDGTCISTAHLDDCNVWLAPSTLPGAGLGIYAGRNFTKGENLHLTGDIVIPIVDISMHQRGRGKFTFLWDEYTWNGRSLGLGHEVIKEINAASPGFGAAANSFLDLINIDEGDPTNSMPNGLHRSKDPGVGAFTTYHDRKSSAKVNIKAGQELFVNYGQHWFEQRMRLGPIPLRKGLKLSTDFHQKFAQLKANHAEVDTEIYDDLWDEFIKHTVWNESRIMGAFMHTPLEKEMLDKNMTLKQVRTAESKRTPEWLKNHGSCSDHIRERVSTIRQAGRGAFATRDLPKGAIVSPLPLIQIIDQTVLEMYQLSDIKSKKRKQRRIVGYQLMMNYCFGHTNSTMLLCPYGPIASLVNHNQTRANVRLQWADPFRGNHNPELLELPIDEFSGHRTANLAMDMVALRDIEADEEILLDYGDDFEAEWLEHVRTWDVRGADNYISAFMLNDENSEVLPTEFEQATQPYPGNINIECDKGIWKRINETLFITSGGVDIVKPDKHEWWVCEILRHRVVDGVLRYTVVVTRPDPKKKKKSDKSKDEKPKEKYLKLTDIPRMAIRFTDRPYTSDMFLEEAFRHSISIPDDIYPKEWLNYSPRNALKLLTPVRK